MGVEKQGSMEYMGEWELKNKDRRIRWGEWELKNKDRCRSRWGEWELKNKDRWSRWEE